jgi:hypothetical protein
MLFRLLPHHAYPPSKVTAVEVECVFSDDDILLTYTVRGSKELLIPAPAEPRRADDLWQVTCFELFLRAEGEQSYLEFNFSPSGQWAAYRFASQRTGREDVAVVVSPHIECLDSNEPTRFAMEVDCDLSEVAPHRHALGLSAIIEEVGGRKSFWALAHPPGEPDFHHPACFAAELPAPARP